MGPAEGQEHAYLRTHSQCGHRSLTRYRTESLRAHGDRGAHQSDLCEDPLAHAFRSMAGERMDDFMAHDRGEAGLVIRYGKDPRIDRDFSSRQAQRHSWCRRL